MAALINATTGVPPGLIDMPTFGGSGQTTLPPEGRGFTPWPTFGMETGVLLTDGGTTDTSGAWALVSS